MDELIKAIQDALSGVKTAVNTALGGLPPVEQFEANAELSYGLRTLRQTGASMIDELNRLSEKINPKVASAMAEHANAAILAEVTAGNLFKKADHEAALNSAVAGAQKSTETDVTAKFENQIKVAAQRSVLLVGIPAAVAAKFPEEVLVGANAAEAVKTFKGRIDTLSKIGVTAENSEAFLADVAAIPLTAEGDTAFGEKIKPMQAAFNASKAGGKGGSGTANNPLHGAPKPGAKDGDAEKSTRRYL